tara:strand:+ start:244 stop:849 length:606 start_codon:yes stop_codon:yes gene_type:complete
MSFLSIDCSTDTGSLFVKIKNKTFSKVLQSDKFNNDLLMVQILNFFKQNNIKLSDFTKIFVNQGPGNFSGLRASLAIAKGISLSKNLKLYGYDTFILASSKYYEKKDLICSITKFREKYFIKKFGKKLNIISDIEEIRASEIIKKYYNEFKVIPKNEVKSFDEKILKLKNLNIIDLNHIELEFLQLKGLLEEGLIKPLYLS